MSDYIKRDIERIIANAQECDIDALTWEEQKERLKAVKSADVAPVRHGRWESFEDVFMETCYECSECGLAFYLADGGTPKENKYHYCPNCGARMDGENDEID